MKQLSEIQNRMLKTGLGVSLSVLLFLMAGLRVPLLDTYTDSYFTETISKAGLTYAAARVLNGTVSVLQESQLQLEPAGVGVSLAVGQMVDPINDMTERLSDVLVLAIASLGIQKLIYEMSISLVPPLLAFCLLILTLLALGSNDRTVRWRDLFMRITVLLLVGRFCLPISAVVNGALHEHFFASRIGEARLQVILASGDEHVTRLELPEGDSTLGVIAGAGAFIKDKALALKDTMARLVGNMGQLVEHLLDLTLLYVGSFMIEILLLPLAVFWLLSRMVFLLFPESKTLAKTGEMAKTTPVDPGSSI